MRRQWTAVLGPVLLSPAALFMAALALRELRPFAYEPAHSAERLVLWYAGKIWTLWVLLLALPLTVLVSGCAEFFRALNRDLGVPQASGRPLALLRACPSLLFISATTIVAGMILGIVVLHVLAN